MYTGGCTAHFIYNPRKTSTFVGGFVKKMNHGKLQQSYQVKANHLFTLKRNISFIQQKHACFGNQ